MSNNKCWLKFSVIFIFDALVNFRKSFNFNENLFNTIQTKKLCALGGKFSSPARPTSMNIAHDSAAVVVF